MTAVEVLPVFEYDELEFQRSPNPRDHMVNIWGYSHLSFFAPMSRCEARASFSRSLIAYLHPALGPFALWDLCLPFSCTADMAHTIAWPSSSAVRRVNVHQLVHVRALSKAGMLSMHGRARLGVQSTVCEVYMRVVRFGSDGKGPAAAGRELKQLVKALHAAGIEVLLDVVYNHTVEGVHAPFALRHPNYLADPLLHVHVGVPD